MSINWGMVKKMWYIYTMKYYSAIKKVLLIYATTWMYLKIYFEQKNSDTKGYICHMIPFIWTSTMEKIKLQWQKVEKWWPGAGGGELTAKEHRQSFGMKAIVPDNCGSGYVGYTIVKTQIVHLECLHFIVCNTGLGKKLRLYFASSQWWNLPTPRWWLEPHQVLNT